MNVQDYKKGTPLVVSAGGQWVNVESTGLITNYKLQVKWRDNVGTFYVSQADIDAGIEYVRRTTERYSTEFKKLIQTDVIANKVYTMLETGTDPISIIESLVKANIETVNKFFEIANCEKVFEIYYDQTGNFRPTNEIDYETWKGNKRKILILESL